MKLLKRATLVCVLAAIQCGQAQVIDKLRTFYTQEDMNMIPALFFDSVGVLSNKNDTLRFRIAETRRDPFMISFKNFWLTGGKVYDQAGNLFYDYNLVLNDVFYFKNKWTQKTESLLVDSVYHDTFGGRILKVWSLRDSKPQPYTDRIRWVEGIGSMDFGWDYSAYNATWTEGPPQTAAICVNDTMLYWDTMTRIFREKLVNEDCNYRALIKKILPVAHPGVLPQTVRLYPVPASGVLNIELDKVYSGHIEICNALGQVLLTDDFESRSHLTYSLSPGSNGVLFVRITNPEFVVVRSFYNQ